jgi:3'-phosphoadenosine 5'-phosphosulfate (PAPS) 3'-phosphatase
MLDLNHPEIQFALNVTRRASLLVRQVQAELVTPALTKDDHSPVTVADYAAQALIGWLLAQAFPQDWLVAEEDSSALRTGEAAQALKQVTRFVRQTLPDATPEAVCAWIDHRRTDSAERFWTLDPIDGTKGFLRGDQYAIALALVVDGHVQIGVLGCPNLTRAQQPDLSGPGSLVIAVRERAWTSLASPEDFQQLQVSTQTDPAQTNLLRSFQSATPMSARSIFCPGFGYSGCAGLDGQPGKVCTVLKRRLSCALSPSAQLSGKNLGSGCRLAGVKKLSLITDLDGKPLISPQALAGTIAVLASNRPCTAALRHWADRREPILYLSAFRGLDDSLRSHRRLAQPVSRFCGLLGA